ncbi:MAG TPA: hypothetical protein VGR08_10075 [Thermomicrobiales bacterium]|nr:hypothetical protein [Thermomicrobiales bacterium]
MESLLVNAIIGFWLIAFGAMALFPLLLDMRSATPSAQAPEEDQVISIQPVGIGRDRAPIEPLAEGPYSLAGAHDLLGIHPGDGLGMDTDQRYGASAVRTQPRGSRQSATPETMRPLRRHAA